MVTLQLIAVKVVEQLYFDFLDAQKSKVREANIMVPLENMKRLSHQLDIPIEIVQKTFQQQVNELDSAIKLKFSLE